MNSRLGVWVASLAVAAGLISTKLSHRENRYVVAQRQTVLIETVSGSGSGVVIERRGEDGKTRLFVWTANHVVDDVDTVTVKQFIRTEGRKAGDVEFTARLIRRSLERDIALFWLDAPVGYFRTAEFSTEVPEVGDPILHVGNVMGAQFDGSVSSGIVSQVGVKPTLVRWPWKDVILDCATVSAYYGCSGGPVFRLDDGRVLGLIVGSATVGDGYINYTPTREIKHFADRHGVFWAVTGEVCPNDDTLEALVLAHKKPKEVINLLDFVIGPTQEPCW